jgi:hypothetical protein
MIGKHPKSGSGILGPSATQPEVVVAANGGADLIYLPSENASALLPKIVSFLLERDYVSGLFVDDKFGQVAGTLPLSAINLRGLGKTPVPAIIVNFRSGDTGCGDPAACGFAVTDWYLQQGQGMHGSFARSDTLNNMAAVGPDFQRGFVDTAPVSNADLGATVAALLRLPPGPPELRGRIVGEALVGRLAASPPPVTSGLLESAPGGTALLKTTVKYQESVGLRYFAAGGFPGRTGGL